MLQTRVLSSATDAALPAEASVLRLLEDALAGVI
jgi:hypothetical protein